jgi:hypothetical protein
MRWSTWHSMKIVLGPWYRVSQMRLRIFLGGSQISLGTQAARFLWWARRPAWPTNPEQKYSVSRCLRGLVFRTHHATSLSLRRTSPRALMTICSIGMDLPASSMPRFTIIGRPPQHGTSMITTVTFFMEA